MRNLSYPLVSSVAFAGLLFLTGCGGADYPVQAHVEGQLTVSADVDSTEDYAGFRVSVLGRTDGDVDTLATAVTGQSGEFAFDVGAPEPGIYPLTVERSGVSLSMSEYVIADGDSTTVTGRYPLGARGLRIVSNENAAWTAYRNAKALHNRSMADLLESDAYTPEELGRIMAQTSTILYSIKDTFTGTMGADLALAESVVMLEGWDDSTVVARYPEVALDNESIVEVVRAARRSTARLLGGRASMELLESMLETVPENRKAGILAEMVLTYADSSLNDNAVEVASRLQREYPESEWAGWAARATYDLENLQPGMEAPAFSVTTREGEVLNSSSLLRQFVILEFYDPAEPIFMREFAQRDYLASSLDNPFFEFISVSVEPDEDINDALFEERSPAGHWVYSPEGMDQPIVKDFNVNVLPTRFLIDPDGRIVAKYSGPALVNLEQDLIAIIGSLNEIADRAAE